jgi:hypothetical protein
MGVNLGGVMGEGGKFPSNISPILRELCQWKWKNNTLCYTFNTPNSFCYIGIKNIYVLKVVIYKKIQVFRNMMLWQWVSGYQHLRGMYCLPLKGQGIHESATFLRDRDNWPNDISSCPSRTESSETVLWQP